MPPKTELYQSQYTPQGDLQTPGYRASNLVSAFGSAANDLARGVNSIAEAGMQQLDDDARAWAANATSQADTAAYDILSDGKKKATDGAPKFRENVLEEWTKYQDETMQAAPNERTKQLMQVHFDSLREGLAKKADEYEQSERLRWRGKQADDGIDADARLISNMPPEEIDQSIEKSLGKWNAYFKAMDMDPATRQLAIDTMREKLTNAANIRKIQADPASYLAENSNARQQSILATDPSAPRGIRNNNPGNLRTDVFQGTKGVDDEGYAQFETPEQGLRAQAKNLITQQEKHGLRTVEAIISKYAPPNENNTIAYINAVSAALDVKPDEQINVKDPETLQKLMNAMIKHENGVQPYSPLQIAAGADAALNGKEIKPLNAATPDKGGRVITGNTTFNMGTWEQQQKWIGLAETEKRRVDAERKQIASEAKVMISSAKERMENGYALPEDEASSIAAIVAASGDAKAAKSWLDLQDTKNLVESMQQLNPAQLANVINTQLEPMAQRDGATEREAMQLEVANNLLSTMTTKLKNDPLSWAARTGIKVPILDFNKVESLPKRVAAAEAISEKYGLPVEDALFSSAEKIQLSNSLEGMDDGMKLALAKRMQIGFGKYFTKVLGKLSSDEPVFSHAAFLSGLSEQNDNLALDILRGQRILKENPKLKPSDEEKRESLADIGNTFDYMPEAIPGIIAATDALYVRRSGFSDEFDQDIYDQALRDVLGERDGAGGIGELNGQNYLLPFGFTESDLERGLQVMTADELAEMSIGGSPPIYGKDKKPVSGAEIYGDVQLRSIAYGQYALYDSDGLPLTSEKGPKGKFILAINPEKFMEFITKASKQISDEEMNKMKMMGPLL